MPSFTNLLVVVAVAFLAPLLLGLGHVDQAVQVVALLGLGFVLFLAGLGGLAPGRCGAGGDVILTRWEARRSRAAPLR